ncbi:unnamed protein product [Spirodela intermedia]|uniref:Uncharacterized protein n=1 Tax=Spirodela intermedia TaxID=51605 RepID=A0ABN7E886_SPIIN|nr:unnamed protein product [Spirodela intermedia]
MLKEGVSKLLLLDGGEQDPSPPLHKFEVTEEPPPSRIQLDQGARVKMKDPGFHYTA